MRSLYAVTTVRDLYDYNPRFAGVFTNRRKAEALYNKLRKKYGPYSGWRVRLKVTSAHFVHNAVT